MSLDSEYSSDDHEYTTVYEDDYVNPFATAEYEYETNGEAEGDGLASIDEANQNDDAADSVLPASIRKHFEELKEQSESLRQQCQPVLTPKTVDEDFQALQLKIQLLEDEVARIFGKMHKSLAEGEDYLEEEEEYSSEGERNSKAPYVCEEDAPHTPGTPVSSSTSFRKEIAKRLEKRGIRLFSAKVTKVLLVC